MRQYNSGRKGLFLRRAVAVLFFAASLVLASLRSGALVYAMLYLSVLLPVLSALYTLYVYYRLRIVQLIENRFAIKNEPVEYTCRLANETASAFTPIRLEPLSDLSEIVDFDSNRTFSLAPGEKEEVNSFVTCRRRGVYTIGVDRILITDILGLMTFSFPPPVEFKVTVYPRVLHLDSFGLFNLEGSKTRHSRNNHETEPADTVRDYEQGDDPRMIHWKASARTGTLKVRQLGDIERPAMVIIVDTRRYSDDRTALVREDNLLETLLAICDYCVAHGIPVDIHAPNECFIIRSHKDFRELYDWSCHVTFTRSDPDAVIPNISASCCALLTTGENIPASTLLEPVAAAGTDCVFMEFGRESKPVSAESSRLKHISVPDECCIERLLS